MQNLAEQIALQRGTQLPTNLRIPTDAALARKQRTFIQESQRQCCVIMKKYNLLSEIRRRRKWANLGQQAHKYKNLLNRNFHADKPNQKWVTDISYIHTKQRCAVSIYDSGPF